MIRLWMTFAFHLPFFNRTNYFKYVMEFEGYKAMVMNADAAFDGEASEYFVELGNSTNSMGIAMLVCDKIWRGGEHKIGGIRTLTRVL